MIYVSIKLTLQETLECENPDSLDPDNAHGGPRLPPGVGQR